MIALLSLWGLSPLAAMAEERNAPSFSISLDSRSWTTLTVGVDYPLATDLLRGSAKLSIPILDWISGGGIDTYEAALGLIGDWEGAERGLALGYGLEMTVGGQDQDLGRFLSLGTRMTLTPSWDFGTITLGPTLRWDRVWISRVSLSEDMKGDFELSDVVPDEGWVQLGASVIRAGLGLRMQDHWGGEWNLATGARIVPGSLIAPMEGFPVGEWPFWFELGWRRTF